jgi:RNA polymerase sigma factor (sigma-70 family)
MDTAAEEAPDFRIKVAYRSARCRTAPGVKRSSLVEWTERHLHTDEQVAEEPVELDNSTDSPEQSTSRAEIRSLLERKIESLPVAFRTVFVLREVDELSGAETAECLSITEATVRSRLFRARGLLRESLSRELDMATPDVFHFGGEHCDRIVSGVLGRVRGAVSVGLIMDGRSMAN